MARYNTINMGPAGEQPQTQDAIASVAIKPGSVVVRTSGSFALATAATTAGTRFYFADHNWAAGGDNDTNNAANETMIAQIPLPRSNYAALLANGQNVANVDTPLTFAANGELAIGTPGTDPIVAWSTEAYNNTSGESQLIAVRVA